MEKNKKGAGRLNIIREQGPGKQAKGAGSKKKGERLKIRREQGARDPPLESLIIAIKSLTHSGYENDSLHFPLKKAFPSIDLNRWMSRNGAR